MMPCNKRSKQHPRKRTPGISSPLSVRIRLSQLIPLPPPISLSNTRKSLFLRGVCLLASWFTHVTHDLKVHGGRSAQNHELEVFEHRG